MELRTGRLKNHAAAVFHRINARDHGTRRLDLRAMFQTAVPRQPGPISAEAITRPLSPGSPT
jgi:hypothetical protein